MVKPARDVVWVLGSEGLLGRTWASWLRSQGVFVIATGSSPDVSSPGEIDLFLGKLEHSPSLVINCAALTGFDRCEKDPEKAFLINAEGPELLGQLANKYGFKLIHFSSDTVFEGGGGLRTEGSLTCPVSTYSRSKLEGERRLLAIHPQALLVRSSWLFGHHRLNFVLRILHSMAEEQTLHLVEDQVGRPTSVFDLIRWTWELRNESGIWHIANDGEASWYELALEIHRLAKSMGLPIRCEEIIPIPQAQLPSIRPRSKGALLDLDKARLRGVELRSWQAALQEVLESCLISCESLGYPKEPA